MRSRRRWRRLCRGHVRGLAGTSIGRHGWRGRQFGRVAPSPLLGCRHRRVVHGVDCRCHCMTLWRLEFVHFTLLILACVAVASATTAPAAPPVRLAFGHRLVRVACCGRLWLRLRIGRPDLHAIGLPPLRLLPVALAMRARVVAALTIAIPVAVTVAIIVAVVVPIAIPVMMAMVGALAMIIALAPVTAAFLAAIARVTAVA